MVNKTSVQALKAMVECAKLSPGEFVGVAKIASNIQARQNYLGKVLQELVGHGLLKSRKGRGGGFCLAGPAGKISLYQILDVIEGLDYLEGCFLGGGRCSDAKPCALHRRWAVVSVAYIDLLKKTSLADIL